MCLHIYKNHVLMLYSALFSEHCTCQYGTVNTRLTLYILYLYTRKQWQVISRFPLHSVGRQVSSYMNRTDIYLIAAAVKNIKPLEKALKTSTKRPVEVYGLIARFTIVSNTTNFLKCYDCQISQKACFWFWFTILLIVIMSLTSV